MPFGVGSFATYLLRKRKYEQALAQKDEAIAFFDRELAKPVLSEFSGVEMIDATVVLLDATLERYMRESKNTEKLQSIRLYLNKLEEVYRMHKDDLENIPATRKEMLALGLAVRHMAVALDQEFESLKSLKYQVNQELAQVRAAGAEQAKAVENFKAHVSQELGEIRSDYARQIESLKIIHDKTRLLASIGVGLGALVILVILLRLFALI
jgi:hypothetical protein